jgi:23S rRNA-/tRNA-specific pseudouridylate synthase
VYLYRELRDEVPVPFDIPMLYPDDDIVVVDKPHFLATMPGGGTSRRRRWSGCAASSLYRSFRPPIVWIG